MAPLKSSIGFSIGNDLLWFEMDAAGKVQAVLMGARGLEKVRTQVYKHELEQFLADVQDMLNEGGQ